MRRAPRNTMAAARTTKITPSARNTHEPAHRATPTTGLQKSARSRSDTNLHTRGNKRTTCRRLQPATGCVLTVYCNLFKYKVVIETASVLKLALPMVTVKASVKFEIILVHM